MSAHAIFDYGFLLTKEEAMALTAKQCLEDGDDPEKLSDEDYLRDAMVEIDSISHYGPNCTDMYAWRLCADGGLGFEPATSNPLPEAFLLSISKWPKLFGAAYSSVSVLVDEIKAMYENYLPEDFNYTGRLCFLAGVEFD